MINMTATNTDQYPMAESDRLHGFGHSIEQLQLYPLPPPDNILARPLTAEEESRIDTLSRLQFVSRL